MLGALSLMEFRAYLKMCHQQAEKLPTLTDSALCLTRNNRVLLEGSGKSKILQTGSSSQRRVMTMPELKPRPCPFCGADIKTTGKIMRADGKIVWKHGYVGCAIDGSTIVDVETWNSCPREEDKNETD